MAYLPNIPQPTDQLNDSQPQLLGNFQAIKTLVDVNHVTFDDPSGNQGKHKWVALPNTIPPTYVPPVVPGEVTLFNTVSTDTLVNEFTIIKSDGTEVAATASSLSVTPNPANGAIGWTFLPSGILIWFVGTTSRQSAGNRSIALNTLSTFGFPPFTSIYRVQVTPFNPGATASTSVSVTGIPDNNHVNLFITGQSAFIDMLIIGR